MEQDFYDLLDTVRREVPLVERLRGIPPDVWKLSDFDEELAARQVHGADLRQKADSFKWMIDVFGDLVEKFPELPIQDLVHLLPELERSMVDDIMHPPPVKLDELPIQRSNRQVWHESIERTIISRMNLANWRFTTGDVVDEAKIPAPVLEKARRYAEEILFAAMGRRIQPGTGQPSAGCELINRQDERCGGDVSR